VFDSSRDREPLEFTLGSDKIIPGFEQGLISMQKGETKTLTLPPEEAYGSDEAKIHLAGDVLTIRRWLRPEECDARFPLLGGQVLEDMKRQERRQQYHIDGDHDVLRQ